MPDAPQKKDVEAIKYMWNIYNGYSYENMDKYLESIKEMRPKEYKLLVDMKETEFSAYSDFESAMKSELLDENKNPVVYHPISYIVDSSEKPITGNQAYDFYKKNGLEPLEMPLNAVSRFIDDLADNRIDFAMEAIKKDSEILKQYGEYGIKGFWKKSIKTKDYLQIQIKNTRLSKKALNKAEVHFDIMTFLKPQDQYSNWTFVRVPMGLGVELDKDGKWLISKQLQ